MAKYTNKKNSVVTVYTPDGVVRFSQGDIKELPANAQNVERLVKKGKLELVEETPAEQPKKKPSEPAKETPAQPTNDK